MNGAVESIQRRIDAQQRLETIEYALRGDYSAIAEAKALGIECTSFRLRQAKRDARAELAEAKAAVAAFGGVRQLRLAVAA